MWNFSFVYTGHKYISVLIIWVYMLFKIFIFYMDFQYISLISCCVTFLTLEVKFATYKFATIKMYLFWRTIATFSLFFPCNAMSSHLYISSFGKQEDRMNLKFIYFWTTNVRGVLTKIGVTITSCLLNCENFQDIESTTITTILDKVQHNII